MHDKRIYKRTPITLKAAYIVLNDDHISQQATVLNISAEGICLKSDDKIQKGTKVDVSVELEQNETVSLKFEIIWCKKDTKENHFRCGARIIEEVGTDFEKFLIFYCKKAYKSSDS